MSTELDALMLANALEVSDKHPELINVNNRAAAELRRLHAVNAELLKALKWIDRRCPKHLLDSDPHKIHREAAYDAGASARAAIAKAEEVKP